MSKREKRNKQYAEIHAAAQAMSEESLRLAMRELCQVDLFYLLTKVLGRKDIEKEWLFERCDEIQREPDGHLDLWAREHYKSTLITYGKTIQDILNNPEITVGIFSHTKPIAKAFLRQIKNEFETNQKLKHLFPEILYSSPKRQAPSWSEDKGITVKRETNPKEATVEAHGLVDGQPTSKHYSLLVYDDVVTIESVSTTDMIEKVTNAWALSLNLGAHGGARRTIGTRYHFNDTYRVMMERGSVVSRIHPATDDGTAKGIPVFLDKKSLDDKRRDMGPYVYACQMLQNPKAEDAMGFQEAWVRYYDAAIYYRRIKPWSNLWNYYLLCDPASEKKTTNDYTVMAVIALAPDGNKYLVDGIRDRLNLVERTDKLFYFHRKYSINQTGYEKYGKDSDIEHIQFVMEQENYRFDITPLGGRMPKNDRIRRLVPTFFNKTFLLPHELLFVDYEGKTQDFVKLFIQDEFIPFPVAVHDDMLDCIARIEDPDFGAVFPMPELSHEFANNNNYDPLSYR